MLISQFSLPPPGLERGWKVADAAADSLVTMPVIMETSGVSVNSLDASLLASLDDAEEAREHQDEELEALERAAAVDDDECPEPTRAFNNVEHDCDDGEYRRNSSTSTALPGRRSARPSRTSIDPEGELCRSETIESYEATE